LAGLLVEAVVGEEAILKNQIGSGEEQVVVLF
jgi:hypothetical protein